MSRIELIDSGQKIIEAKGTESEIDTMMDLLDKNVSYPNGSNLFFYPENYNARIDNLSKYRPSVEEVEDQCLSYKPIQL